MQRGLLGLVAVGNQSGEEVHEEIVRAAVTGVLDLTDVFELVVDALDDGPFAQEQSVGGLQDLRPHILAAFGDEDEALGDQEVLGERLGDIAAVAEELAEEATDEARDGTGRGTGRRSSTLPGVRQKANNSPRSLTTRCNLKP
jgi:hypothetical protein